MVHENIPAMLRRADELLDEAKSIVDDVADELGSEDSWLRLAKRHIEQARYDLSFRLPS